MKTDILAGDYSLQNKYAAGKGSGLYTETTS